MSSAVFNWNYNLLFYLLCWVCIGSPWDVILQCVARVSQWDSLARTPRTIWQLTKVTRVILIGTIQWQEQAGKQHTPHLANIFWLISQWLTQTQSLSLVWLQTGFLYFPMIDEENELCANWTINAVNLIRCLICGSWSSEFDQMIHYIFKLYSQSQKQWN